MNTTEAPNLHEPPIDNESASSEIAEQAEQTGQYPPQVNTPQKENDPYDQLRDENNPNVIHIHMGG